MCQPPPAPPPSPPILSCPCMFALFKLFVHDYLLRLRVAVFLSSSSLPPFSGLWLNLLRWVGAAFRCVIDYNRNPKVCPSLSQSYDETMFFFLGWSEMINCIIVTTTIFVFVLPLLHSVNSVPISPKALLCTHVRHRPLALANHLYPFESCGVSRRKCIPVYIP